MRKFIFSIAALIISFAAFAQTEGADCANPSTIENLPYSAENQTTMGTCPYTFPNNTIMRSGCHVYKYIPNEDQMVNINISGISRAYDPEATTATVSNVGIFLYNGCPDDENAQLIGVPFVSNSMLQTSGSITNASLTATTEYYIIVATDSLITEGYSIPFVGEIGGAASYTTATFSLSIETVVANDVAIRSVTASAAGCAEATSVSYTIANAGELAADSAAVTVICKVNGDDVAWDTLPALASGATLQKTFEGIALIEGENTIQIVASLEGDENMENNTGNTTVYRNNIISDFPFSENFEAEPYNWNPSAANAWIIAEEEGGNHYYKTDTAVSKNSYISSPCLNFAELEAPELHFDVIADYPSVNIGGLGGFGGMMGLGDIMTTVHGCVLVNIGNSESWDTVAKIDASNTWVNKNISLDTCAGHTGVQIRICYNSGISGNIGGFINLGEMISGGAGVSIDNIVIKEAPAKDLGVIAITGPASGCGLSDNGHVAITIKNYGRRAQSNYTVKYSLDGGENWTEETVTTEIAANSTASYTFTAAMNLSSVGRYDILAKTALDGDEDPTNDEAEGFVVSQGLYNEAVAIFDDEEFINDWYANGTYSSWAFGKTAVAQNDSIWTWATNPNGPVNPGEESYLYTPCYNLTGMTNPIVKISLKYNLGMDMGDTEDPGMGGLDPTSMMGIFGGSLNLQYTINGGSSWIVVTAGELNEGWYTSNMMTEDMSDPGWSGNTNGFVSVKTSLTFPSAANLSSVKFRFAFKTTSMNLGDDESGMGGLFGDIFGNMTGTGSIQGVAINNFVIYECSTPIPSASFTYSNEICSGLVEFTNTSQNADTYGWNFGDGAGIDLGELTGEEGFDLSQLFGDGSTTSQEENPTMTYTASGDYIVTLTATNECGTSVHQDTVTIDLTSTPTAAFSYTNEECTGHVVFTNNSQNADSFTWNFGDSTPTSSETSPSVTYSASGEYTVSLTATNACGTNEYHETIEIDLCTDIIEFEDGISIYPNPASSSITIVNAKNANVEIMNALGQVVYASENISNAHSIDISNLTNGTYFVKINDSVSKVSVVR
ncbi:MAG: PKD domain-containing protein [Bacteroidales bacterium]|nr:PKD domain-containing protein [Bacteroidales bacterium]